MEDITGQKFGNMVVTGINEEETKIRSERYGSKVIMWNVKCEVCSIIFKRIYNIRK